MQLKFFDKNHSDALNILELAMEFLTMLYKASLRAIQCPQTKVCMGVCSLTLCVLLLKKLQQKRRDF